MGYVGIAALPIIGLLAAMAIPAFQKVRDNSQQAMVRTNLVQIWNAAEQQILETNVEVVTYQELVASGRYFQELKPVAGEDYSGLAIHRGDQSISVTTRSGRTIEYSADSPAGGNSFVEPTEETDTPAEPEEETAPGPDSTEPAAPAAQPGAFAAWPAFG